MLPPSAVGASAAGAVVLFTFTPPDEMPLKPAETDSLDPESDLRVTLGVSGSKLAFTFSTGFSEGSGGAGEGEGEAEREGAGEEEGEREVEGVGEREGEGVGKREVEGVGEAGAGEGVEEGVELAGRADAEGEGEGDGVQLQGSDDGEGDDDGEGEVFVELE